MRLLLKIIKKNLKFDIKNNFDTIFPYNIK